MLTLTCYSISAILNVTLLWLLYWDNKCSYN